jgi:hypothetical protein
MDERSRTTHYNSITTEMIGSVKEGQLQKKNKKKRGKLKIKRRNGRPLQGSFSFPVWESTAGIISRNKP